MSLDMLITTLFSREDNTQRYPLNFRALCKGLKNVAWPCSRIPNKWSHQLSWPNDSTAMLPHTCPENRQTLAACKYSHQLSWLKGGTSTILLKFVGSLTSSRNLQFANILVYSSLVHRADLTGDDRGGSIPTTGWTITDRTLSTSVVPASINYQRER